MNYIYSTVNTLRDRYTPVTHTSTFRQTGQITPDEFLAAGDYLVYKFPTWSWGDADDDARRVAYLPPGKQFLVTRNVPCERRLNDDFAGDAGREEALVDDGEAFKSCSSSTTTTKIKRTQGRGDDNDDNDDNGWLRTGGLASSQPLKAKDVRTVDDAGNVGVADDDDDDEDEIPDMEDEDDDEAIIRDASSGAEKSGRRTYTLYIMYTPYYRTPRLYLSGYHTSGQPLPPRAMMDDIVGDYKEKTVTLEDFPFFAHNIKMATVHPCKHAPVMKTLLDRADAALRARRDKMRAEVVAVEQQQQQQQQQQKQQQKQQQQQQQQQHLVGEMDKLRIKGGGVVGASSAHDVADKDGDGWEEVQETEVVEDEENEVAIRVDQYLVVFLKFMASVTPGIEHDFTMGV